MAKEVRFYHVVGPKYGAGDLLCWDSLLRGHVVTEANWDCNAPLGYDGELVSLYATLGEALIDQTRHGGRVLAIDLKTEGRNVILPDGSKDILLTSRAGYPALEERVPGDAIALLSPWPPSLALPPQHLWQPCPYHDVGHCRTSSEVAYL